MPPEDLSVNLKYAELTILSMYEELQIVRATEDTEDDLKASVKQLGNTVTEADQLVSTYELFIFRISAGVTHYTAPGSEALAE